MRIQVLNPNSGLPVGMTETWHRWARALVSTRLPQSGWHLNNLYPPAGFDQRSLPGACNRP